MRGRVDHIDGSTGELIHRYTTVHEPGGVLPVACKTRRASRCAPCAEVYRADTYQLIRAGLTGGKGIPAEVANHPCVFATLTAPSLGSVHARRERGDRVLACRPRRNGRTCLHGVRLSRNEKHPRDDQRLGEPLCPECYDYTGSVLFNAYAPELWRRFTITLRRTLGRLAGLTSKTFAVVAERLGHADPAVTLRIYSHVLREHALGIGDVFARAVKGSVSKSVSKARPAEVIKPAFALLRGGGQGGVEPPTFRFSGLRTAVHQRP